MMLRYLLCLVLLFSLHGYSQNCSLTVKLTSSGTAICSGNSVTLTATPSAGIGPYIYVWSTGETTQSISVNKGGTYAVSVSDKIPGCLPVSKTIDISISTAPNPPTVQSATVCQNTSATLTATAPGGTYYWYDAPAAGNFLGSGDIYVTPPITNATTFFVETTIAGCTSTRTAVTVNLNGKPTVTGATVCIGNAATLSARGGQSYSWYDAPSGGNLVGTGPVFTTPPLLKTAIYYLSAVVNGCPGVPIPVTAAVSDPPQQPIASNVNVCYSMAANLHADASAGLIFWFDVPTGGMPLIASPDFTTPPLTGTTTYYVQSSLNGCQSSRAAVTVTVNPLPQQPVVKDTTICYGRSAVLSPASTGDTFQWFDAAAGGNLLATGNTFITPILNNSTTYFVRTVNGGCVSTLTPLNVTVNLPPIAPVVSGALVCSGTAATLTATSAGGSYQWYDSATGGNILATSANYTTPAITQKTTYYVQTIVSGCVSSRTAATVSVLPAVPVPSALNATICSGSFSILSATGSAGDYAWYDSASNGRLLASGNTMVIPPLLATANYYVAAIVNGCESIRKPVTVTVVPYPMSPKVRGVSVCPGSTANLTAAAAGGGTISWYDAAVNGNLLGSGNSFTTPQLSETTTYYVQNTMGECSSQRVPVTASVIYFPDTQFLYPSGIISATGTNPTPVIKISYGGTFSVAPAGLVFVNTNTGQIDARASKPGKYIITFTNNSSCGGTYSSDITILSSIKGAFAYDTPYCQGGINPTPVFKNGYAPGIFSSAPAGLVFANHNTGEVNLSGSKAGTYMIFNTTTNGGPGAAIIDTTEITIDGQAIVNAGPAQTLPFETPVQLAGSITGSIATGTWSGGAGTFSNPNLLNAIYTPTSNETVVQVILTSGNPIGLCGPKSDTVTINFGVIPPVPTALGTAICSGSNASLTAIAPGGIYHWYNAAVGGTLISTGAGFITPALVVNTTYYVETTENGITSPRTAVQVRVNPIPIAPSVKISPVCSGSAAVLTATGSAPGSYLWYDDATGGNLLSVSDTYITGALSINTTVYVQSTVNSCTGPRTKVDIPVTPAPKITSATFGFICSGNTVNYTITADLPTATFLWGRAQVAGISNPAVTGQTSGIINETLINTSHSDIEVTYTITPFANGCPGPVFNYVVKVYSTNIITSSPTETICTGTSSNYAITSTTPGIHFYWSRAAVPGISNAAVAGQTVDTIREVLFNTTNTPITVNYIINYKTLNCDGAPFTLAVTVNPAVNVTSAAFGVACSGSPQNYSITSNVPSATFSWKRNAVTNIANLAIFNQTSSTINETLINNNSVPYNVFYVITPTAFGCQGPAFNYIVSVNPQVLMPDIKSNSPVCAGSTISLNTTPIPKAAYLWTGPNGYTSTLQNPEIGNVTTANSGIYKLNVTVNGCTSPTDSINVVVNMPPLANAGADTVVCINIAAFQLDGHVSGGTTTGIWTTDGTGTFAPSANLLNAQYIPSNQDKANGFVTLKLTSASKDNCNISSSDIIIKFGEAIAVNAGNDQNVCSQVSSVALSGKILIPGGGLWSSSGTGSFSPSPSDLNASYIPNANDIKSGSVILTLLANDAGECYFPTGKMKINFIPPPIVNAGGTRYILAGRQITLTPTVSDTHVQYTWTPNVNINNTTIKDPVITGNTDITYTLTVTDSLGCTSLDRTIIKVSPEIKIPNTFTPNGDGVNDKWDIQGLIAYQDASVDIFNRWGQKVYHSTGYGSPWDGTFNAKPLPVTTYYYIIDTKMYGQVLSGSVTIIR